MAVLEGRQEEGRKEGEEKEEGVLEEMEGENKLKRKLMRSGRNEKRDDVLVRETILMAMVVVVVVVSTAVVVVVLVVVVGKECGS